MHQSPAFCSAHRATALLALTLPSFFPVSDCCLTFRAPQDISQSQLSRGCVCLWGFSGWKLCLLEMSIVCSEKAALPICTAMCLQWAQICYNHFYVLPHWPGWTATEIRNYSNSEEINVKPLRSYKDQHLLHTPNSALYNTQKEPRHKNPTVCYGTGRKLSRLNDVFVVCSEVISYIEKSI